MNSFLAAVYNSKSGVITLQESDEASGNRANKLATSGTIVFQQGQMTFKSKGPRAGAGETVVLKGFSPKEDDIVRIELINKRGKKLPKTREIVLPAVSGAGYLVKGKNRQGTMDGLFVQECAAYFSHKGVETTSGWPQWVKDSIFRMNQAWNMLSDLCAEARKACSTASPEDIEEARKALVTSVLGFNAKQGRSKKVSIPKSLRDNAEEPVEVKDIVSFKHKLDEYAAANLIPTVSGTPAYEYLAKWIESHPLDFGPINHFKGTEGRDAALDRVEKSASLLYWEKDRIRARFKTLLKQRQDQKMAFDKGWPRKQFDDGRSKWEIRILTGDGGKFSTEDLLAGKVSMLMFGDPVTPAKSGHGNHAERDAEDALRHKNKLAKMSPATLDALGIDPTRPLPPRKHVSDPRKNAGPSTDKGIDSVKPSLQGTKQLRQCTITPPGSSDGWNIATEMHALPAGCKFKGFALVYRDEKLSLNLILQGRSERALVGFDPNKRTIGKGIIAIDLNYRDMNYVTSRDELRFIVGCSGPDHRADLEYYLPLGEDWRPLPNCSLVEKGGNCWSRSSGYPSSWRVVNTSHPNYCTPKAGWETCSGCVKCEKIDDKYHDSTCTKCERCDLHASQIDKERKAIQGMVASGSIRLETLKGFQMSLAEQISILEECAKSGGWGLMTERQREIVKAEGWHLAKTKSINARIRQLTMAQDGINLGPVLGSVPSKGREHGEPFEKNPALLAFWRNLMPKIKRLRKVQKWVRETLERRREKYFESVAHDLCDKCDTLLVKKLDLKALAEQKDAPHAIKNSQKYRMWASLALFVSILGRIAKKRRVVMVPIDGAYTTSECHICGDATEISGGIKAVCPRGHEWDVDFNAVRNLLKRHVL